MTTVILIIIAALVLFPFAAALFINDSYSIEKEIVIAQPNAVVYNYIRYLENQENFNKWMMADPQSKTGTRGSDGSPGFVYSWHSQNKQVGKGEQEITAVVPGQGIDTQVRFEKPFRNTAAIALRSREISASETEVQWCFKGQLSYMMKVVHLVFNLQKALGKDLETSLANLKVQLEKQ